MIFSIQQFTLHDGLGLRSTIFMKGCSLHCPWCSNPEGQNSTPELMFDSAKCIHCLDCLSIPNQKEMYISQGKVMCHHSNNIKRLSTELSSYVSSSESSLELSSESSNLEIYRNICPTKALQVVGDVKTAKEIGDIVLRDAIFYRKSGGGVTLSGGEPLLQANLCKDIAEILKSEDIPLSIETCLQVPWMNIKLLIPYTNEFLCDVKHSNPKVFTTHTGGDLSLILQNLQKLSQAGASFRVRIPVIYGFNHDPKTIGEILDLIKPLKGLTGVDFLPYHPFGAKKYASLGRNYTLPQHLMPKEELAPYIHLAELRNIPVTLGG